MWEDDPVVGQSPDIWGHVCVAELGRIKTAMGSQEGSEQVGVGVGRNWNRLDSPLVRIANVASLLNTHCHSFQCGVSWTPHSHLVQPLIFLSLHRCEVSFVDHACTYTQICVYMSTCSWMFVYCVTPMSETRWTCSCVSKILEFTKLIHKVCCSIDSNLPGSSKSLDSWSRQPTIFCSNLNY